MEETLPEVRSVKWMPTKTQMAVACLNCTRAQKKLCIYYCGNISRLVMLHTVFSSMSDTWYTYITCLYPKAVGKHLFPNQIV